MADLPISGLPSAGALSGTEPLAIVQSGATKQTTVQDVANLAGTTPPLADVLNQGNTSGANDIIFDTSQGLQFNNSSKLREGTTDAGLGGNNGIAQVCSLDYELKWEAGRLYVMQQDGTTIRQSLYNFTTTPTATDDSTKGYAVGSLWTLDDGTTYECIDATATSADWIESSQSKFIEVTKAQLSALEGAGTLTLNVWYRVTDALANTAKILVSALSTSVVSKAAVNLTDNSFGQYTLSSDYYVPISGGSSIPKATASGTDTYTATISGVTTYNDGDAYLIRFTNGNTDAATLNISGVGTRALYRNNDGPLIGGDIWDGGEMLCIYNSTLNGFQCIGTSPNSLYAYVVNADSVAITRGQPVYAFGSTGNRMSVKLANNQSDGTSAQTYGLVYSSSIAAGQKGIIIIQGVLSGLSLGGTWADGDAVYLGNTAGAITKTKPSAPEHLVYLGVVERANAGNGIMYVRVQNGYELDEIHDVAISSVANNDVLQYENSTSLWKNVPIKNFRANIGQDKITNRGDAIYSILSTDKVIVTNANFSASRTWTLPAANSVNAGYEIIVADLFGGVSSINTLVIARAGSDTINGASSVTIGAQYGMRRLISDGVSKWTLDAGVMRISDYIGTTLTASVIVGTDSNSKLQPLPTATYPSLTELARVKGVTAAIQTQINAKRKTLQSTGLGTAVSGNTNINLSKSILIPANTFVAGDIPKVTTRIVKSGGVGGYTPRMYLNTANNLSGAILLGTGYIADNTNRASGMERVISIEAATGANTFVHNTTNAIGLESINYTGSESILTIDWTVDQYLLVAIQLTSAVTDSANCRHILIN